MPKRTKAHKEFLTAALQDPREAAGYLNAALEDSAEMFLVALRNVADAHRLASVAETIGVARETLYRMLSAKGNPTYNNLTGLLSALGVRLHIEPVYAAAEIESSEMVGPSIPDSVLHGLAAPPRNNWSDALEWKSLSSAAGFAVDQQVPIPKPVVSAGIDTLPPEIAKPSSIDGARRLPFERKVVCISDFAGKVRKEPKRFRHHGRQINTKRA
jgi:probable addiction module antidote protein